MSILTPTLLRLQDDVCSSAALQLLKNIDAFKKLALAEGNDIIRRDAEDAEKLNAGINIARAKGVLADNPNVPQPTRIQVAGLTAQEVTEEILRQLPTKVGNIIVMQGLSGTGKGTTVKKLQTQLPRCVTWSNGNVFRSYTYLCHEKLKGNIRTDLLTPELLQEVEKEVKFEKMPDGEFDIILKGKLRVSEIQNTLLKTPEISKAVPTVAEQTQGEVIRFAASAVKELSEAGYNVILEGRAQTLNYIPTPLRFELVIDDVSVLGERRAAQRVMARALSDMKDRLDTATDKDVETAVLKAVTEL
ncbi:Cytidylate kinase domain [Trypanosoma melophagium]|uniref:Cytidylate kinase domain n=1 Tax=Trypanosoma melophagium TaxID=715481 RepID=UPI003519F6F5|nr:Cytidylate kinase domain [Trypanosoma melophagium]